MLFNKFTHKLRIFPTIRRGHISALLCGPDLQRDNDYNSPAAPILQPVNQHLKSSACNFFLDQTRCYTSYCMRLHFVIFFTLLEISCWFFGGLWLGGVSLLLG
uniref:Uncharacterized protein n=1 Tax=Picea glauca TaxID=3330 RepID=A0A101LTL6_PICGL|nr:hypothetical protein ABT39_MTgene4054 [Picea glauca]